MQYALLVYSRSATPRNTKGAIDEPIATVLARPYVTDWARLHGEETATTVRAEAGGLLLTDGPFVDSKEYLAGIILIEADNLDAALEVAQELQAARPAGAIEVRPIIEAWRRGS